MSSYNPRFNPRYDDTRIERRLASSLAGDKFLMLEKLPLVHERAAPLAAARMIWYMVLMDSSCLKNPWTLAFCGGAISPHHDDCLGRHANPVLHTYHIGAGAPLTLLVFSKFTTIKLRTQLHRYLPMNVQCSARHFCYDKALHRCWQGNFG